MDYAEMVGRLAKPGSAIVEGLTWRTAHLLHMAVGVSGEAGELLDAVKKTAIYCKPLDPANVVEELGDLEFYMEGMRQAIGVSREECLAANMEKLARRYPAGFSNAAAQARADKAESGETEKE